MVAIVSGNGAGLLNTSLGLLGRAGASGQGPQGASGEAAYLNIANGNLVLQRRDDFLAAPGVDLKLVRTYNAQGQFGDGTGRQWKLGLQKQVGSLIGAANTVGSRVTRLDGDGSATEFHYDQARGRYLNESGSQSLSLGSDQKWTWRDEQGGGLYEVYDAAHAGRVLQAGDAQGARLTYGYNAQGLVATVTTAAGDVTHLDYDANGNLTQYRTVLGDTGASLVRVRYGYDAQDRLVSVTTDLSPEDGSIADGKVYTTNYSYDGSSARVASIEQSDGTRLAFTYRELNGTWKVDSVIDAQGTSRLDYSQPGKTVVTDAAGVATAYSYDAQGQLVAIGAPAGPSQATFAYDAHGNVVRATLADGQAVAYEYDARGNRVAERDANGRLLVQRGFAQDGRLMAEIAYDANYQAHMTSYVYDVAGRLAFVVAADGHVSENRYNAAGQRIAAIQYPASSYTSGARTESTLRTWVAGELAAGKQAVRTDYSYDVRGLVAKASDASGTLQYVYDQAGQLVQSIDKYDIATNYSYDGLGRLLAVTRMSAVRELADYDTAGNQVVTSFDGGMQGSSVYGGDGAMTFAAMAPMAMMMGEEVNPGNDSLTGTSGNDYIDAGAGNDTVNDKTGGSDTIEGGAGDDIITDYGTGSNILRGGDGNDTINFDNISSNTVEGGAGNDTIKIYSANGSYAQVNSLSGGTGNDRLESGASADTYLFNRGDGSDTISDNDYGSYSRTDTLVFGPGISSSDLVFSRTGNYDLVVKLTSGGAPTGDQITLENWYNPTGTYKDDYQIETFSFADGSSLTKAQVSQMGSYRYGTIGNDSINVSITDDGTVLALAGNDTVIDAGGNDTIDGGAGNDSITDSGYGSNSLMGGDGDDTISFSQNANNTVEGGAGNDLLKIYTTTSGNNTNLLTGGAGNDRLEGGSSADTYLFNRGDGSDTINDYDNGGYGRTDKIVFGPGIAISDVSFGRVGTYNLLIKIGGTPAGDQIVVENWFQSGGLYQVETLAFANGQTLDRATVTAQSNNRFGTEVADNIASSSSDNGNIYGLGGNDTITDNTGDDSIDGGAGNDSITDSGTGRNTLLGQDGDDTIVFSETASNTVEGGSGNDLLKIYSRYYNTAAPYSNQLAGGLGNDRLESGDGADTYLFNRGDGSDTILDYDYGGFGKQDRIVFGPGIAQADLAFSRAGNDLLVNIKSGGALTGDMIRVESWYDASNFFGDEYQIENMVFADGTSLSKAAIKDMVIGYASTAGADSISTSGGQNNLIQSGAGNDTITDDNGSDTIDGGDGNDSITDRGGFNNTLSGGTGDDTIAYGDFSSNLLDGGAGNDYLYSLGASTAPNRTNTLVGGLGNDKLYGSAATDTYIYNRGDGQDTIRDDDSAASGYQNLDKLVFGPGIASSDLVVTRSGTSDLLIKIYSSGAPTGDQILIEKWYDTANGVAAWQIEQFVFADGSTQAKAEFIQRTLVYTFGSGADTIYDSNSESLLLQMGGGNDSVWDNGGNDTVYLGDGNDSVSSTGKGNSQYYGEAGNDTVTYWDGSNNTVDGGSGDDSIGIINANSKNLYGNSNLLIGGTGNDRFLNGNSADTYLFNLGDGRDTIFDRDYWDYRTTTDRIVFGSGITSNDLSFSRTGPSNLDLLITIKQNGVATTDSICVQYWFDTENTYKIERLEFANSPALTDVEITTAVIGVVTPPVQTSTTLDGSAGNDTLTAGSNNMLVRGLGGNDSISGSANGNHTVDGGAGDDTINFDASPFLFPSFENQLTGGLGNDRLVGGENAEIYFFNRGDGQDVIFDNGTDGPHRADRIRFGAGISAGDLQYDRVGTSNLKITLLSAGVPTGDQITIERWFEKAGLYGDKYQIEFLEFAGGSSVDKAFINQSFNVRNGTAGADAIVAGGNDSGTMLGLAGNDTLTDNGGGDDYISGGDGNDSITDTLGSDTIDGGDGNDTITDSGQGSNLLRGGKGNDSITGGTYSALNVLEGGEGDDILKVAGGETIVNYLSGGAGNDRLEGSYGADNYYFNRGDGQDTIYDSDGASYGRNDQINFGSGIAAGDLALTRVGVDDLLITVNMNGVPSGESIKIEKFFYLDTSYTPPRAYYRIEKLAFADGSSLSVSDMLALGDNRIGTEGADTIALTDTGSSRTNLLGGNDVFTDAGGNDTTDGGAGNDSITDNGAGNNILRGGDGNDTIQYSSNSANTVEGGLGDDRIKVNDASSSANNARSNVLSGGAGNDRFDAGAAADTYLYNRGDGFDTISDVDGTGGGLQDRIVFGPGISMSDLSFARINNYHLIVNIGNGAQAIVDQITIENWFTASGANTIESFEFADGSVLGKAEISRLGNVRYGTNSDEVFNYPTNDGGTILASGGNDTITDDTGSDTLDGGAGNDSITDNMGGSNLLRGGDGNDTIRFSLRGSATVEGGDGNDSISANDTSYGYDQANILAGGGGNDTISSGLSADTYLFNRGDGQDTIIDTDTSLYGKSDKLVFGAGIGQADLAFSRINTHDLLIKISNGGNPTSDQLVVQNWFSGTGNYKMETLVFGDGTTLTAAQVTLLGNVRYGTVVNDTLPITSADSGKVLGLDGNDSITDDSGSDTIEGGAGNDTITDNGTGNNLLRGGDGADSILYGSQSSNTVEGGAGNDTIKNTASGAFAQSNTLVGGQGNDSLEGRDSADTYVFYRGDGQDTIYDYDYADYRKTDRLVFGPGIVMGDLQFSRAVAADGSNTNNLLIKVGDAGNPSLDTITVVDWFLKSGSYGDTYQLELIEFADGSSMTKAQVNAVANVRYGTDSSGYLTASGSDSGASYGLGGNDTITDDGGSDTIDGGVGNDSITDSGTGNNLLSGGDGADTITFSTSSNNTVSGGTGNDLIKIYSTSGASGQSNQLAGGLGNDRLEGGSSADTYLFNRGDGQDTINDYDSGSAAKTDRLRFGPGIRQSDLTYVASGSSLLILVNDPASPGRIDQITIENWYSSSTYQIEVFEFADGSSFTASQLPALTGTLLGTSGSDTIQDTVAGGITSGNTILLANDGNDTIIDSSGSDTIQGGNGNDVITDQGGGRNVLQGQAGNDTINFSGNANNMVDGGIGDDLIQGGGNAGTSNVLAGGTGNDRLVSGSSNDTYLFQRGDGFDTISDAGGSDQDVIEFGPGITQGHLSLSRVGNHMVVKVIDPYSSTLTDQVTIENWFTSSSYVIEKFRFADGIELTSAQVLAMLAPDGKFGGLGVENMELGALGSAASLGKEEELALVNSGNGNFVLQDDDLGLASMGLDFGLKRTYNSQAGMGATTWGNWQFSVGRSVRLDATTNTAYRSNGDGSESKYVFDGSVYRSVDGQGAYDKLVYDAGQQKWTWTDGDSNVSETYDASKNGRLTSSRDVNNNVTNFAYTAGGALDYVTTASGEKTTLVYDTAGNVKSVKVDYTYLGQSKSTTRVYYDYDAQRRLTMVRTDLTPDDNSIADGNVYWTMYSYDGDSGRISGIAQKDGTSLRLTYEQDSTTGAWWVKTMADGLGRVTTVLRAVDGNTIQDAAGHQVKYGYDGAGKLQKVTDVTTGASSRYTYDANGNVKTVTDIRNVVREFDYDSYGNQTLDMVAGIEKTTRTFGAPGQMLTETIYAYVPGGVGQTTRYAYDAQGRVRFQLSPEGRVTEWRYNAKGEQVSMIDYAGAAYGVGGLAATQAPSESQLASWVSGQDLGKTNRTDYTYDSRSLLATATSYSKVAPDGTGMADGSQTLVRYTYDQDGLLCQTIDNNNRQVSYVYDGLGRLVGTTDSITAVTMATVYDDAGRTVITTGINGNTVTEVFNRAGELLSSTHGSAVATGTTSFVYDAAGRPVMVRDAAGNRSFMRYDAAGRKVADIDADGSMTEYRYNSDGALVRTVRYATPVDLSLLLNADGTPKDVALSTITSAPSALDRSSWNVYDLLGRLVQTVGSEGELTTIFYDGASHIVGRLMHAVRVDVAALAATNERAYTPIAATAQDSFVRTFFSDDGLRLAELDGAGSLVEYGYDAAGQLVSSTAYRAIVAQELREAGTLVQLRSAAAGSADTSYFLYNGKGQQVGSVDAAGYLTETTYDQLGNVKTKTHYATSVTFTAGATVASLRPATQLGDRSWSYTYNTLNQLETETTPDTTITRYTYDKMGNVLSSTLTYGTPVATTALARYDVEGRLMAEVPADAAWRIAAAGVNAAAIEAVWTNYGVSYQYDATGRRVGMTAPGGARTLYYYDADGRLAHTVNTLGQVQSVYYNAFNQAERSVNYGATVPAATLATMSGGNASALADVLASLAGSAITSRTLYDHNGRVQATIDPLGALTSYAYDAFGNVSEQRAFANAIDPALTEEVIRTGLAAGTFADAVHDQHQRFAYDNAGRLAATFTALQVVEGVQQWSVATRSYDGEGRLAGTTAYVTPLSGAAPTATDLASLPKSIFDQRTRLAYDALGRLAVSASVHSEYNGEVKWTLQQREYDANGLLVVDRILAAPFISSDPSAADLVAGANALRFKGDSVTRYAYDEMGRVTAKAVSLMLVDNTVVNWAVTSMKYDLAGNLLETTEYAAGLSSTTLPEAATNADYAAWMKTAPANVARDRTTRYVYDAGNRLHYTIDAMGEVTGREYDARGNVVQVTAYATAFSGTIGAGFVPVTSSGDVVTRTVYDKANRPQYQVDAEGGVSEYRYDALGNLAQTIGYANRITTLTLSPATTPADMQALLATKLDAANDRSTRNVYDNDGRLRFTVDAQGYVTEKQYNALGQLVKSLAYADYTTLAAADQTLANLSAFGVAELATGYTRFNSYEYDAQGHVSRSTDVDGKSEYFRYDGAGNKIAFINKLGNEWNYQYLASGKMWEELAPPVDVVDNNGVHTTLRLATHFTYHALGMLDKRIEAAGVPGYERVTEYDYDLVGRQVKVWTPKVPVYNSNEILSTAAGIGRSEAEPAEVTTIVVYDALGNAIINKDVGDRLTRKVYDKLGRVKFDIDAKGQVTGYEYDALGNRTALTRYAEAPNLTNSDYSEASVAEAVRVMNHAHDRTIRTTYDRNGNAVKVVEPASFVYDVLATDNTAAPGYGTLVKVTLTEYNGFGEARQQRVFGADAANPGNVPEELRMRTIPAETRLYYNQRGERIAQYVLANTEAGTGAGGEHGGYVTTTDYNAFGDVRVVTEYAALVDEAKVHDAGIDAGAVVANDKDRRTAYSYDLQGRKAGEQHIDTEVGIFDGVSMGTGQVTAETRYAYDALGNLMLTTDAGGGEVRSYYDASGRVTAVTAMGGPGGHVALTTFARDVYGNVVIQTQYAGEATASDLGYTTPLDKHQDDRTTTMQYNRNGNMIAVKDGENHWSYMSYDIYGRVAKQWQQVTIVDAGGASILRTTYSVMQYDELGQVVKVITPGSGGSMGSTAIKGGVTASSDQKTLLGAGGVPNPNTRSSFEGANRVNLTYPDLGSGPVKVELFYTEYDGWEYDTEFDNKKAITHGAAGIQRDFFPPDSATGATLEWADSGEMTGGIRRIDSVKVYVKNEAGEWVQKYFGDGPSLYAGTYITDQMSGEVGTKVQENQYNAFGELESKRMNGEEYEFAKYDDAGNVWSTNAGDGVAKLMFHNIAGQITAQIRSNKKDNGPGIDLAGFTTVQAAVAAVNNGTDIANGIVRTETRYNLMGGTISQTGAAHTVQVPGGSDVKTVVGIGMVNGTTEWSWGAPDWPGDDQYSTFEGEPTYNGAWIGRNKVSFDLTLPSDIGTGDLRLEVAYDYEGVDEYNELSPGVGAGTATHSAYVRRDQMTLAAGTTDRYTYNMEWSGEPGIEAGKVTRYTVYQKGVDGKWVVLSETPSAKQRGLFMAMPMAGDGLGKARMEYTLPGGAVQSLTGLNLGDVTLFDLADAPAGITTFRMYYTPNGSSTEVLQETGLMMVNIDAAGKRSAARLFNGGGYTQTVRSTSRQKLDRWGNVLEVTDPRNPEWFIRYSYNDNNQAVKQESVVLKHNSDGTVEQVASTLGETFFDSLGREVGSKDGLGHLNRKVYGGDGQVAEEHHADGGIVQYDYNLFGERSAVRTYRSTYEYSETKYAYDHLGHLAQVSTAALTYENELNNPGNLQVRHAAQDLVVESYGYDELGRRNATTSGIKSTNAANSAGATRYQRYDYDGNVLAEIDGLGNAKRYTYDAFGHKTSSLVEEDGLVHSQQLEVDKYGRVKSRMDKQGAQITCVYTYQYDGLGQLTSQTSTARENMNGQDLVYTYDGDRLVKIVDGATNKETSYVYDLAGNHVRERTVSNGQVVQDNHIAYDELGRMARVADGRFDINIRYDAAGNRKEIDTFYIDANGNPSDLHAVNEFDVMNRETVVDGVRTGDAGSGTFTRGENTHILTYDWAGNRTTDTYTAKVKNNATQETTESYTYDIGGRLYDTYRNGALVDRRFYDSAGRLLRFGGVYGESSLSQMEGFMLAPEFRINQYDAAGQLMRQKVRDVDNNFNDDIYFQPLGDPENVGKPAGYSTAGNLRGYFVVPKDHMPQTYFHSTYVWFDGALAETTTAANNGGINETTTRYDANGFVVEVTDTKTKVGKEPETTSRHYVTDASGQVLWKKDGKIETSTLIVNGQVLGSISSNEDEVDRSFANTYQGVTSGGMAAAPSAYVVRYAGETPSSIAQQVWGDSKLWYLIADANGLAGNDALEADKALHIPARANTVHNDTNTFKPYSAADAVGSTSPVMPTPIINQKHCGVVGQIAAVVVAAVAAFFGQYYISDWALAALASAGAAATANAATQKVSMAMGYQQHFNARSVTISAIGGAISGGMNYFVPTQGLSTFALGVRAAASNALTQGVSVALHLQEKFDWENVVAAGVGGWASGELGLKLKVEQSTGLDRLFRSTLVGIGAGATTAALGGGKFNWTQVAVDAFGNALGDSLTKQSNKTRGDGTQSEARALIDDKQVTQIIQENGGEDYTSKLFRRDWKSLGAANPSAPTGDDLPDGQVNWYDALQKWRDANPPQKFAVAPPIVVVSHEKSPIERLADKFRTTPEWMAEHIGDGSEDTILDSKLSFARAIRFKEGAASNRLTRELWHAGGVINDVVHSVASAERATWRLATTKSAWSNAWKGADYVWNNLPRIMERQADTFLAMPLRDQIYATARFGLEFYATGAVQRTIGPLAEVSYAGGKGTLKWLAPKAGELLDAYAFKTGAAMYAVPPGAASFTARDLRAIPGVAKASSDLTPASGNWLDAGVATPIPAQVAKELVGQTFKTFDDLRSAIWKQIAGHPDLNGSFTASNLAQMKAGNAPHVPPAFMAESGAFGERFNLHHVEFVSKGGSVYDFSNLRIVSPLIHHAIHYGF